MCVYTHDLEGLLVPDDLVLAWQEEFQLALFKTSKKESLFADRVRLHCIFLFHCLLSVLVDTVALFCILVHNALEHEFLGLGIGGNWKIDIDWECRLS